MLNMAVLQGRLTRDPELRYTGDKTPVASFSIAVDRDSKKADGTRDTDFINCTAWRQRAEFICSHFKKGDQITVTGRVQVRDYTDKNGNKRTIYEIQTNDVYFGEKKKQDGKPLDEDKSVRFTDIDADDYELPF